MNTVALSGTVRTTIGSKDAAQLRRDKRVPCVLYGGDKVVHFSVEESVLGKLVFTPEVNGIELDLDGEKTLAMIQDKQFHPTTDRVLHVDFKQLDETLPTSTKLSLRLQGQPIGVRKGGTLNQTMRKLRVKGLPVSIPQHLELDIAGLDLNETVRVKDLNFDGITFLERPEDVVVSVKMSKKVVEAGKGDAPADDKKAAAAKKK
jgi:large subunit ribosomal protein L25